MRGAGRLTLETLEKSEEVGTWKNMIKHPEKRRGEEKDGAAVACRDALERMEDERTNKSRTRNKEKEVDLFTLHFTSKGILNQRYPNPIPSDFSFPF